MNYTARCNSFENHALPLKYFPFSPLFKDLHYVCSKQILDHVRFMLFLMSIINKVPIPSQGLKKESLKVILYNTLRKACVSPCWLGVICVMTRVGWWGLPDYSMSSWPQCQNSQSVCSTNWTLRFKSINIYQQNNFRTESRHVKPILHHGIWLFILNMKSGKTLYV